MTRFVCPCCSGNLVFYFRHSESGWFCSHCHEEMPALMQLTDDDVTLQGGSTLVSRKLDNTSFELNKEQLSPLTANV